MIYVVHINYISLANNSLYQLLTIMLAPQQQSSVYAYAYISLTTFQATHINKTSITNAIVAPPAISFIRRQYTYT